MMAKPFRIRRFALPILLLLLAPCEGGAFAQSFQNAKYGGDFLSTGVGARPLAMGGAYVSLASDATAAVWNPAGLANLPAADLALMHSERFAGLVGIDYAAFALPLDGPNGDVVAVSLLRQGVDGIQNTLRAWDPDRNLPIEGAADAIREFSATDVALYVSYARVLGRRDASPEMSSPSGGNTRQEGRSPGWRAGGVRLGGSFKFMQSRLGPFANALSYGLDLGLQADLGPWSLAAVLTDPIPMLRFWSVDPDQLDPLSTDYGDEMPEGVNERILPTLRLGVGRDFTWREFRLLASLDMRVDAENRRAYSLNAGRFGLSPHVGLEGSYRGVASLRFGLTDLVVPPEGAIQMSPTVGAGLQNGRFRVDYGFTDFSGYASELGVTHRVSIGVRLP